MKNNLREIRRNLGLTQEELATQANLSRATIIAIENNNTIPDGETVKKLVVATNKPANEIFFDFDVVYKQHSRKVD